MFDAKRYAKLWGLSGVANIEKQVYGCASEQYGPCVLKHSDNPCERKTLREYSGTRYCEVYEVDAANEVMLLERIVPGTELKDVSELDQRLAIFCEVWRGSHILPADKTAYPSYMDWVSGITQYMRRREDHRVLYEKMAKAEQICRELCETYSGEMLLHGDLHHHNILRGKQERWRIIDPKGVVGDPVFDIPRFILNEFGDEPEHEKLVYVIQALSRKNGVPENDLRRLLYVDTYVCNCWMLEDGEEPNMVDLRMAEKLLLR